LQRQEGLGGCCEGQAGGFEVVVIAGEGVAAGGEERWEGLLGGGVAFLRWEGGDGG